MTRIATSLSASAWRLSQSPDNEARQSGSDGLRDMLFAKFLTGVAQAEHAAGGAADRLGSTITQGLSAEGAVEFGASDHAVSSAPDNFVEEGCAVGAVCQGQPVPVESLMTVRAGQLDPALNTGSMPQYEPVRPFAENHMPLTIRRLEVSDRSVPVLASYLASTNAVEDLGAEVFEQSVPAASGAHMFRLRQFDEIDPTVKAQPSGFSSVDIGKLDGHCQQSSGPRDAGAFTQPLSQETGRTPGVLNFAPTQFVDSASLAPSAVSSSKGRAIESRMDPIRAAPGLESSANAGDGPVESALAKSASSAAHFLRHTASREAAAFRFACVAVSGGLRVTAAIGKLDPIERQRLRTTISDLLAAHGLTLAELELNEGGQGYHREGSSHG